MARRSRATTFALIGLLLLAPMMALPRAVAAQAEQCFAETSFCIAGRFLEYWQANGGLARNGFPLTGEQREILEDGKEYTVQYFERVRLELHPENAAPHDVLLGQFGRRVLREAYVVRRSAYAGAVAPAEPLAGQAFFAETGHNLGGRFLAYWQANGGLAQFGYPITEERYDAIDGQTYQTQYFERARFEYHPENQAPYDVLLGQFGRGILAENALLQGPQQGPLGDFFLTNELAQVQLGSPTSLPLQSAGATQLFEYGRMFYAQAAPPQALVRGGYLDPTFYPATLGQRAVPHAAGTEPTIYVLCGTETGGEIISPLFSFSTYFYPDTWTEGQPSGGGPGPGPGLYEPQRGFGKVWRDWVDENGNTQRGAQACLRYATSPDEVAFTITVQYFVGGALLLTDTPEGRFIYLLAVGRYSNGGAPTGIYLRYPAPAR